MRQGRIHKSPQLQYISWQSHHTEKHFDVQFKEEDDEGKQKQNSRLVLKEDLKNEFLVTS